MPKGKVRKRRVNYNNGSYQSDLRTNSEVNASSCPNSLDLDLPGSSGLGLGRSSPDVDFSPDCSNTEGSAKNHVEQSPQEEIETGISEVIKSCYEQLHSINQVKKQRMEQKVKTALQVSDDKVPFSEDHTEKRQRKLKKLLPLKPSEEFDNDCFSRAQSDCEKSVTTIQKLMKHHQRISFDNIFDGEVSAFRKRSEHFLNAIEKQDSELQQQIIKIQQEFKDEMAVLQMSMGAGTAYQGK